MAEPITDFAKLSIDRQYELAKKYADRLLYALTEEGQLGKGRGTLEEEVESIAKELQRIGSSDFVDLIDGEIRKTKPQGLRKVLIEDYSLDAEDAILNAFGYPTEDVIGKSLQESQASNPSKSDYSKFGPGGTIPSNEFSPEEAVVADEGIGSGKIDPRDQEKFLAPGEVDIAKPAVDEKTELNLDTPSISSDSGENPFVFGTEGLNAQTSDFLDIVKNPIPNPRGDARSRAKFNNSLSSKQFVSNAANRNNRELQATEKSRRDRVSMTEPAMVEWIKNNPNSRVSKKALGADGTVDLDQITDEEKIAFTKNFNLKNTREGLAKIDAERKAAFRENLFNPGPMDKVPVYGKNGLEGYRTRSLMEKDMDGESIKYLPRDETREEREARLLADLKKDKTMYGGDFSPEARDEYYRRTKEPTAEEYYGIQERARARAKTDPTLKTNIADAVVPANFNQPIIPKAQQGPQQPLNEVFSSDGVVDKFQKETIPNMRNKVSSEVSSVLNDVPMPSMPKTVKYNPQSYKPNARTMLNKTPESSTFSIEQPSTPGVDLTRTTKEYPTENVFVDSNDTPGVDLTRTGREYPTTEAAGAQFRRPTQGFGRSGKKQYNIDFLDRMDLDNYDYRPNAPKHPGGGFGRSGKKQYNLDFLNFLDPDNYFYNQ